MDERYYYDYELEKKIIAFCEKLNLDKGTKGQKIKLLDFQRKIICDILCWKNADGTRKYREAFIFLPRKNGKSFVIALVTLFIFFCDEEYGQEAYVAANSRDQAGHLYDTIKQMVLTNKTLQKYCKVIDSRKKIQRKSTNSVLQVLSSDASKADGYNPSLAIIDETHEAKNTELYDKLKTGMGTRKQPLLITITTASNGQDENNLEYATYLYAKKVINKEIEDDAFYSAIYEANEDCDLLDEEQWYKANPALNIFRDYGELKREALKAQAFPALEATFRRLYLNQHIVLSNEQAINMKKWALCNTPFDIEMLKGRECYAGLDLATTTDLTAFVMVFPIEDKFYILPHFFKPSGTLLEHEKRDNVKYSMWANQGLLHATEGDHVSFRYVRQIINECALEYRIKEIAFDTWGSEGIVPALSEDGFTVADFRQGFKTMSPTIKNFYELLFEQRIKHGNNSVLNWMAGNVVAEEDAAGNIKFAKNKSKYRIDGIIAMLMGLQRAYANTKNPKFNPNQYAESDFLDSIWK